MSYIRVLGGGKSQIIKDLAFCSLLEGILPEADKQFSILFNEFDNEVRTEDDKITREALSNVHGDWYEWLLAICAWNYFVNNQNAHLAILLPNVVQFDVATLYEKRLNDLVIDLKRKVAEVSEVQLITSNPDFVIIDGDLAREVIGQVSEIHNITPESLMWLEGIHQMFIDKCNFEEIEGYISVKTSLRPDRRLQISHEGSLMKALYAHLQTREWITSPKGLKYYAVATKITEPDRNALKTVATHSLTTVFSLPQAAVDEVYEVNTLQQANLAFSSILS
ncbi:MAG: Cfr10I/Bse634I family restriction endonuclease [Bacteroidetes bacterium]|nr:Cfr10I/Bse634I family restriction endonuclease [Bacteroidota bacterium]